MSTTGLNQSYELSLTSTIVMNVVIAIVIMLLYPVLRFLLPSVYSPNMHLPHRNTGILGEIFWFADVFMQPLYVFSQRGNMTLIFAVFQTLLLGVYTVVALIAATILIPTYLNGRDQAFYTNYLTVWSRMQLSHVEEGSSAVLIPVLCCVLFTGLVMFFYYEFYLIYVYFRQKCLRRAAPQNYVVMLSSIPGDINSIAELERVIRPISHGIAYVVPIPHGARSLTSQSERLRGIARKIQRQMITLEHENNELIKLRIVYRDTGERDVLKKLVEATRGLKKRRAQLLDSIADFKEHKQKLSIALIKEGIGSNYFDRSSRYPPRLPAPTERYLSYFEGEQDYILAPEYPIDRILSESAKDYIYRLYLQQYVDASERKLNYANYSIGSYAFFVCKSQKIAAEKYTTLVAADQKRPEVTIAPAPADIQWSNLGISTRSRSVRGVVFAIVLACLFVLYFFIQAIIMGELTRKSDEWTIGMFKGTCPARCYIVIAGYADIVEEGFCGLCYQISNTLVTFIPTMINSLLMSCLPFLIDGCIAILGLVSRSKAKQYSYNILFVFLILIQGIIQVALPSAIQPETGTLDLKLLFSQSINGIITALGSNLPNQTFVFINYIIAKYFLFPIIGLLNIPNLCFALFYYFFDSNKFELTHDLQHSPIFHYYKQMAYVTHMFVVYFIFAIVAPFTNIIVLFTYLMMVVTDRYYILYIAGPYPSNELTPYSTLMKSIISNIFCGLVFMLVSTFAFFMLYDGWQYIFGEVVIVLCLLGSIWYKISIDLRFKRGLIELSRGDYENKRQLAINPASNENGYEDVKNTSCKKESKGKSASKPTFLDKCLEPFYCDLADLPVSFTNYQSLLSSDCQSVVLEEANENYELDDTEVHETAKYYTHPSIGYCFGKSLSVFCD